MLMATATATAICSKKRAALQPRGAITTIITPTRGWTSVTNPAKRPPLAHLQKRTQNCASVAECRDTIHHTI
ncbi:hypothetical protein KCP73_19760 [Salmonella enterica subsp. enterica]|nr:hypothetical protein KCP73_19760 [Salmonella enterica subsp. enterica]